MTDDPNWLTEPEMAAWLGYRRMHGLLDLHLARELAADGLSEPDYDVLTGLSAAPDRRLRIGDLADRMLWSKSRVSHHVTRMQQRGLVTKVDCADDGRGCFVVLTDDGMAVLETAAPHHVAAVRRHLIDLLTPAEVAALASISEKVLTRLRTLEG